MRKAIRALNERLRGVRGIPTLLMISGGSALELLEGISLRNMGRHITITVLDERYSTDPTVNNFSQLAQTHFFKKAEKRGIDYIDTRVHRRISLKGLAKKFEKDLRKWKKRYREGEVLITQGIGEDGHTAGIMPYPENPRLFKKLFDNQKEGKWVLGYNTDGKNEYPSRVTVTLPFLREIVDHSILYVAGQNKKGALKRVMAKQGFLAETPARIIGEMKNVQLFTDLRG